MPNTGPSSKGLVLARDHCLDVRGRKTERVRGDKRQTEGARLRKEERREQKAPSEGKVWCESGEEIVEEEEEAGPHSLSPRSR